MMVPFFLFSKNALKRDLGKETVIGFFPLIFPLWGVRMVERDFPISAT